MPLLVCLAGFVEYSILTFHIFTGYLAMIFAVGFGFHDVSFHGFHQRLTWLRNMIPCITWNALLRISSFHFFV
ncbi:MAG: hypothetical protein FE048_00310 [Thermoplasmata archaeon]|nr:MAG: hypothetical protein FE048_00310 [Thermoplasmata archaeon]